MKEYELRLSQLAAATPEVAGKIIYAGAGVITDAIRESIKGLPVVRGVTATEQDPIDGITATQKRGLLDGLGISPMQVTGGFYNVKIGFDGYNQTKTKKFPQGQPNQMIARAVESGTTLRKKHPFVRPAVKSSRKAAEQAMTDTADREIKRIMG